MDRISKEQRSLNMSKIRSGNTKPEILLRKYLSFLGYRYRIRNKLPGRPDIVFPGKKTAVFVNGCFWHQHRGCRFASVPKSNLDYWEKKLQGNKDRDRKVRRELRKSGWKVFVLWECGLKRSMEKEAGSLIRFIS